MLTAICECPRYAGGSVPSPKGSQAAVIGALAEFLVPSDPFGGYRATWRRLSLRHLLYRSIHRSSAATSTVTTVSPATTAREKTSNPWRNARLNTLSAHWHRKERVSV